ncbi:hypothetical protein L484_007893 [Morus notabilis]|uniref:VQ domain-containing protein n=1 Tax=Morus notabilis TaxID=981085 RepID=W9RRK8_9ROSA|nr:VQ motif-containing protein 17 [Morus notabilis]EXC04785.1 hypothetical protein L484_007893 [Morus notabilis]
MEAMTKKQTCAHLSTSPPPSLAIHKASHTISKAKPKIRIIHIFAPEIIKTDVANFRELVQRLTGKPTEKDGKKIKQIRSIPTRGEDQDDDHDPKNKTFPSKPLAKRADTTEIGLLGLDHIVREQRIKEEDQEAEKEHGNTWINGHDQNINSGGFLERFADLEGFIEELNHEFPLFPSLINPLEASNSHVQFGFGGPQLA